jgi:hypothetical protein
MAMKYIMFRDKIGSKVPFIFPATVTHAEFAKKFPHLTPVSAGTFQCDTSRASMSGESVTLGLKSQLEDVDILKRNADFYC